MGIKVPIRAAGFCPILLPPRICDLPRVNTGTQVPDLPFWLEPR